MSDLLFDLMRFTIPFYFLYENVQDAKLWRAQWSEPVIKKMYQVDTVRTVNDVLSQSTPLDQKGVERLD